MTNARARLAIVSTPRVACSLVCPSSRTLTSASPSGDRMSEQASGEDVHSGSAPIVDRVRWRRVRTLSCLPDPTAVVRPRQMVRPRGSG
ncbi:MAG: hypothetical protein ACRDQD_32515, partial [Nocardioidaceae bacterium]